MKLFEEIEGLVSSKINVIKTMMTIIKLETRLAGLSVYPLLLNLCLLIIVLMTIWFSSMSLLGYFAILAFNNTLLGIGSIILLNLIFFVGLLRYLSFNLKNMSFEKTRQFISSTENEYDPNKKKIDSSTSADGTQVTLPTN